MPKKVKYLDEIYMFASVLSLKLRLMFDGDAYDLATFSQSSLLGVCHKKHMQPLSYSSTL